METAGTGLHIQRCMLMPCLECLRLVHTPYCSTLAGLRPQTTAFDPRPPAFCSIQPPAFCSMLPYARHCKKIYCRHATATAVAVGPCFLTAVGCSRQPLTWPLTLDAAPPRSLRRCRLPSRQTWTGKAVGLTGRKREQGNWSRYASQDNPAAPVVQWWAVSPPRAMNRRARSWRILYDTRQVQESHVSDDD
jgi:hypothetical protein